MNERVEELALQAWNYADANSKDGDGRHGHLYRDKFAELIVNECAQKGFDIFDEEPDAPASDLQYYVRDGIKEHFGVE
jgi:hypothetical protein